MPAQLQSSSEVRGVAGANLAGGVRGVPWSEVDALAEAGAARAAEIEDGGRLPDDLLERVLSGGFLRLGLPARWGGVDASPLEVFRVTRRVAAGDGSVGWLVGAAAFFHNILAAAAAPALQEQLFSDPKAYLAGSVAGRGTATAVDGGYEVEGSWGFSSGCWGAHWLGGLCQLEPSHGAPPAFVFVVVPAERAEIRPSWDVVGLRGTGSDTVVLPRQRVPSEWAFPFPVPLDRPHTPADPNSSSARGLWPTAFAVAATQLGIARRSLDEAATFARTKHRSPGPAPLVEEQAFVRELTRAEAAWQAAVSGTEAELIALWDIAVAGERLDVATRVRARLAASQAAHVGAAVVRTCFDLAGAGAIGRQHPLARCDRDGTILSHHAVVNAATFDALGRVRLQLDGDSPFV